VNIVQAVFFQGEINEGVGVGRTHIVNTLQTQVWKLIADHLTSKDAGIYFKAMPEIAYIHFCMQNPAKY
jgi:hypothetical protein